ncbi:MAG: BrnT family toxin [Gammaproteobacteria bacterium]|nr:BrnT family toxin [Gammaproteobacteria bacterium]
MATTYEWDEAKRRSNLSKHGVDFLSMHDFEWGGATVVQDLSHGEERWIATGFIGIRLCVAVFTEPEKNRIRVISLRKASAHEERMYVEFFGRG